MSILCAVDSISSSAEWRTSNVGREFASGCLKKWLLVKWIYAVLILMVNVIIMVLPAMEHNFIYSLRTTRRGRKTLPRIYDSDTLIKHQKFTIKGINYHTLIIYTMYFIYLQIHWHIHNTKLVCACTGCRVKWGIELTAKCPLFCMYVCMTSRHAYTEYVAYICPFWRK